MIHAGYDGRINTEKKTREGNGGVKRTNLGRVKTGTNLPYHHDKPHFKTQYLDGRSSLSESSSEDESEDDESMVNPPSLHIRTRSIGRVDDG